MFHAWKLSKFYMTLLLVYVTDGPVDCSFFLLCGSCACPVHGHSLHWFLSSLYAYLDFLLTFAFLDLHWVMF